VRQKAYFYGLEGGWKLVNYRQVENKNRGRSGLQNPERNIRDLPRTLNGKWNLVKVTGRVWSNLKC